MGFQSTPSSRRATIHDMMIFAAMDFQSTPSSRRATVGGDHCYGICCTFNPRPPHGGRLALTLHASRSLNFQSTPSSRRATSGCRRLGLDKPPFNPRPPHGGRLLRPALKVVGQALSIHALLTEGDPGDQVEIHALGLSIHALLTEGDQPGGQEGLGQELSIHALLTEGDMSTTTPIASISAFNPRPPHGGRHTSPDRRDRPWPFNPRPPHGGRQANIYRIR